MSGLLADLYQLAGKLPPGNQPGGANQGQLLGAVVAYLEHGPAILTAAVEHEGEAVGTAAKRVESLIVAHGVKLGEDAAAAAEAAAAEIPAKATKSYDELMAEIAELRQQAAAPAVAPGDAAAEVNAGQAPSSPVQAGPAEQPGIPAPHSGVVA